MIYILEDDKNIRELIIYTLENQNLRAKGFEKPSEFWQSLQEESPDLILLDIMLPEKDGLSILKNLRNSQNFKYLPIIMLTAKNSDYDVIVGLDNGADDYISKPFKTMELISRIKALLRRSNFNLPKNDDFTIDELYFSSAKHIVTIKDKVIPLTLKEFNLLYLLYKERGKVLSRDKILNDIWGYDFDGGNRTVDVHIRTLRHKIGNYGQLIETIRGVGYKLKEI